MNEADVLRTHTEGFYGALKASDFRALSSLYSDDNMLVRPDGSVLSKEEVLRDVDEGGLEFREIELTDPKIRIYGDTAVLTGASTIVSSRAGKAAKAHLRIVAVYVSREGNLELVHFQSVPLPAFDGTGPS